MLYSIFSSLRPFGHVPRQENRGYVHYNVIFVYLVNFRLISCFLRVIENEFSGFSMGKYIFSVVSSTNFNQ